jgi:hypothetical protein
METKEAGVVSAHPLDAEPGFDQNLPPEKKGTYEDQRDMFRMGKAQEMRVRPRFHPHSAILTLRSETSDLCPSLASP